MACQKKPEIVDVVAPHAWKTLNRSADYITVKDMQSRCVGVDGYFTEVGCSIFSYVDVVVASWSLSARAMQGARLSNNRRSQLPRLNRLR